MVLRDLLFFPLVSAFVSAGLLVGILVVAFWIWMIVDCATRKFRNDIEKIVWLLVIVFARWVGALVYFIVVRSFNPKGIAKK